MRKIAINRVLSLLLAICFVLSIGFPNIYAVDGEVKSEASPFEQFVTEYGVPEAENIFYGLLAVTNYFGPVASRLILVELGWEKPDELEDKKAEEEEKNV